MNGGASRSEKIDRETVTNEGRSPLAILLYTDLMFGVQMQNMARKAGYRVLSLRPGELPDAGDVLIVDLSARADWESAVRKAHKDGLPVIAFGPHIDSESRRKAKAAGATRVLANSNLARDLPGILVGLRDAESVLPGDE